MAKQIYSSELLTKLGLLDTTPRRVTTRELVEANCRVCKNIFSTKFSHLKYREKEENPLYICRLCAVKSIDYEKSKEKIKKTNMERYGAETPFQSEEVKKKIAQTNLERYGVENPMQSKEIQAKTAKTNLERYGYSYHLQNPQTKERIAKNNLKKYNSTNPGSLPKFRDKAKKTMLEKHGHECSWQVPEIKEKIKKTNLERYGCENPVNSPEIQGKIAKTNLNKYDVENPLQSPAIRKRISQTSLERYGVENPMQSKEIQAKTAKTNLERYGAESLLSLDSTHQKARKERFEKYGVEHPMQVPEFKEKSKQTSMDKYGFDSPTKSPEVQEKIKATNIERHGVESVFSSLEVREKIRVTNTHRYGVDNPMKFIDISNKAIEKSKATNLERYGSESPFGSPEVQEKIRKTMAENNYQSSGEKELSDWITSTFSLEIKKSYCGGANPCEIDIHIPEKGISIEYNGDYWHSEKFLPNSYHLDKTNLVREQKNTQLIHIFDSEWQDNKDAVKAFLSGKLSKGLSVRASKCEVREVSWEEAKEFCKYHLQSKPSGSILSLGLYLEDELISLTTFSNPHRQNMSKEPHLSRYVIKPGYRIHGGLSKLSQEAFKKLGKFITYVHLRLSNGDSYLKSGYKLVKTLKPDYWYFDSKNGTVVSKQSRKKSIVNTPKDTTEHEHALMDGLFRVYDCGKLKFIYGNR